MTVEFRVGDVTCQHKQTSHICGTHARYVLDRCRCEPCRQANTAYENRRRLWAREFPLIDPPLVVAAPVVEHVRSLMADGMGLKRIGKMAGVAPSLIGNVVYGRGGSQARPATRIRRETAAKLLAVTLDLADGAKVDAAEAKTIIGELVSRGWTKAEIGRRVHGPHAVSLQAARTDLVLAGTLRTLRGLLVEPVPPRVHNVTGRMFQPDTGHRWRMIPASTPGVPEDFTPGSPKWLAVMREGLARAVEQARERVGPMFLEEVQ